MCSFSGEVGPDRPRQAAQITWGAGKDVARCARGGPDQIKALKTAVHPDGQGRQMAQGCHAADGKAGDAAHRGDIGAAQSLARKSAGARPIHLLAAARQEKIQLAACPLKQDRLDDLVEAAASRFCGLLRGAGLFGHLNRINGMAARAQGCDHAGKGFGHRHLRFAQSCRARCCGASPAFGRCTPLQPTSRRRRTRRPPLCARVVAFGAPCS